MSAIDLDEVDSKLFAAQVRIWDAAGGYLSRRNAKEIDEIIMAARIALSRHTTEASR